MIVEGHMDEIREVELVFEHSHRAPNTDEVALIGDVRQRILDLAIALEVLLPPSRAKAVTHTKLDEVRMWACNAVLAHSDPPAPLKVNIPVSGDEDAS